MTAAAAALLLIYALLLGYGTINALRSPTRSGPSLTRPMWLPAMLTAELLPIRLAAGVVVVSASLTAGALEHPAGPPALLFVVVAWILQVVLLRRSLAARGAVAAALGAADIDVAPFVKVDTARVLTANPYRLRPGVERLELSPEGSLSFDLYRGAAAVPAPVLIQVHGGSWGGGDRRQQGRPLIERMVDAGWVAIAPSYPLAPAHRFPEQLIALKRLVAWVRTEADGADLDPSMIAVSGGSAGGHLASLLALTGNDPVYQPGFEHADTSVQAAVPFYGIYDLLNRRDLREPYWDVMTALVGAAPTEAEPRYREASPIDRVNGAAPPFLVIHGSHDSLVPAAEGREFALALAAASPRVVYLEVPGATHAFDTLHSIRCHHVISGVHAFLDWAMRNR